MAAIAGGEYQRAIVLFERLLRQRPGLGEAWHNLGIARFRLKDYSKAIAAFSQALCNGADPAEVLAARAAAYGAMHDFANARPDIERATRLKPDSPAVKRQWALLKAGKSPNP
jgi:tetratricopeptide (TPR) repeat protein